MATCMRITKGVTYVLTFGVGVAAVLLVLLSGGYLMPPNSITTPLPNANGQEEFSCERLGTSGNVRYITCTFPNGEKVRCLTDVFVLFDISYTCFLSYLTGLTDDFLI